MPTLDWSPFTDWPTVLGLVFGGCCSNAVTLERLTSEHPDMGSLITFCQFLLVSLHGIRKFLVVTPGPFGIPVLSLRPRRVPLAPYIVQVVLYSAISLLNNAAFAYKIPMPVHIIFRSGGLVVNLVMGRIMGKRYGRGQIVAVVIVTVGVILTTTSAAKQRGPPSSSITASESRESLSRYLIGVAILSFALILSGFLGVLQDFIYKKYSAAPPKYGSNPTQKCIKDDDTPAIWEESMFYMHFLSLPTFAFVIRDMSSQATTLLTASHAQHSLPIPSPFIKLSPILGRSKPSLSELPCRLHVPGAALFLLLNAVTQLFCSAGVNRLASRVSSLTVTLVLVVRKAVSLVISIALLNRATQMSGTRWIMFCAGASLVFLGTIVYASSKQMTTTDKDKVD